MVVLRNAVSDALGFNRGQREKLRFRWPVSRQRVAVAHGLPRRFTEPGQTGHSILTTAAGNPRIGVPERRAQAACRRLDDTVEMAATRPRTRRGPTDSLGIASC